MESRTEATVFFPKKGWNMSWDDEIPNMMGKS